MIEIPESKTLAHQLTQTLTGRTVTEVFPATHPLEFTWYAGDPSAYTQLSRGRRIVSAEGCGPFADLRLEDDVHLAVSGSPDENLPAGCGFRCPVFRTPIGGGGADGLSAVGRTGCRVDEESKAEHCSGANGRTTG